jgi:predicted enzyme related to lactoylglutathione lyase
MATANNGRICYIEIPASDIEESAEFYSRVFGWQVRQDNAGDTAFDDASGQVSGMWVTDRAPMRDAGIIISIMVDDAADAVERIREAGGEIYRAIDPNEPEIFAWFRDPGGNLMGIYQEPSG